VLTAKAPGKKPWEARLRANEAEAATTTIPPLEDLPTASVSAPPASRQARSPAPAIALGAVAAVGVGVGVGLFVAHGSQTSAAQALSTQIAGGGGRCALPGADPRCAALASKASSSDALGNGSTAAFVVSGAAAAAMVLYLVWPTSAPTTAARVRVLPVVGDGGRGGLSIAGSF
jgi:hypothetical protein